LREGHSILKVHRIGSGKDTQYMFTPGWSFRIISQPIPTPFFTGPTYYNSGRIKFLYDLSQHGKVK
jgi:hypothetical protein